MSHVDLISNGHQTLRQMIVILPQERDRDHDIVDVAEHKRLLRRVLLLRFEEGGWVFTPVPQRVQVMRGMVAVVETVAVALPTGVC